MEIHIKQFIDQQSFLLTKTISPDVYLTASRIVMQMVNPPLNTEYGLMVSYDKPLGCKRHITNFQRPAVLRQHFGKRNQEKNDHIFCYGSGSGSSTVGTHPAYSITREMTPDMVKVGSNIFETIKFLDPTGMSVEPFNHCTVLFYFHKQKKSPNSMLGFHTDNVYSKKGKFITDKNTQKENTPTCVLTLGAQRELHFQKQYTCMDKKTKKQKWKELTRRKIVLEKKSIIVLHPHDECPKHRHDFSVRWRHGVPTFNQRDSLSIALVFRTVTSSACQDKTSLCPDISNMAIQTDIAHCHKIHKRLKHLTSKVLKGT